MKNKLQSFGAAIGIFVATAVISYAASSLIPTYAPGENPPDLNQAPLLYRMAGQTDPDSFDYANDSLKAIGEKLDAMDVKMDGVGGGDSAAAALGRYVIHGADALNPDDMHVLIGAVYPEYPNGVYTYEGVDYPLGIYGDYMVMQKNLNTHKYSDGTSITQSFDHANDSSTASFAYQNNAASDDEYGAYYTNAAVNTGKLCPPDWRVPTGVEFQAIYGSVEIVDGTRAGHEMMSTEYPFGLNTSGWNGRLHGTVDGNYIGTNENYHVTGGGYVGLSEQSGWTDWINYSPTNLTGYMRVRCIRNK